MSRIPPLGLTTEARDYIESLQDDERVVECGHVMMRGCKGTVYHNKDGVGCVRWDMQEGDEGQMSTSVTWGTRRIGEEVE